MSREYVLNRKVALALIARGLLPEGCSLLKLEIGVDGATVLSFERYVSADELGLLAEALKEVAQDQQPKVSREMH